MSIVTNPETFAIVIRDRNGNIIDTADFDFDKTQLAVVCHTIEEEIFVKEPRKKL